MAVYVVGDLQGCLEPLQRLLQKLKFRAGPDQLWLTGDLVNRGPESLAVLRFVRDLGDAAVTVLGNHDLHLLSAARTDQVRRKDTFQDVLDAPDAPELLDWLLRQPLLHEAQGWQMVHAGLAPQWDCNQARALAEEARVALQGPQGDTFLRLHMYGDEPSLWDPSLAGFERLRCLVNFYTRLRLCDASGRAEHRAKASPGKAPKGFQPWFSHPLRAGYSVPVLFGHWSLLGQIHWPEHQVYGLDTGCVWGGPLTALELASGRLTQVPGLAEAATP